VSNFPSSLPSAGSASSSATLAAAGHASLHNNGADESRAIATKVGTGASTPTTGTVLRASGAGTSSWAQVNLSSDVTGVLPVAQGGTGTTGSTGNQNVVLSTSPTITTPTIITPAITAGGSWAGSPVLATPTIADLTNVQHTHANAAGGGQLPFSALLSTIFSGQLTTATNSGTAGGTLQSINLGGIKIAWGITGSYSTTSNTTTIKSITFPVGFFSASPTLIEVSAYYLTLTANQTVYVENGTASSTGFSATNFNFGVGNGGAQISWIAIGT
jgi:hypothetical protein